MSAFDDLVGQVAAQLLASGARRSDAEVRAAMEELAHDTAYGLVSELVGALRVDVSSEYDVMRRQYHYRAEVAPGRGLRAQTILPEEHILDAVHTAGAERRRDFLDRIARGVVPGPRHTGGTVSGRVTSQRPSEAQLPRTLPAQNKSAVMPARHVPEPPPEPKGRALDFDTPMPDEDDDTS